MRTITIGDIHGCYYTLLSLLDKVQYNKQEDKLIFLGDYIDRGKHSYKVVEFLINLQDEVGTDKCICLLGNHEDMALYDTSLWQYNGGNATKTNYHQHDKSFIFHHWWFRQLPLMHETDNFIYCHAGLPKTKTSDNTADDILWSRNWIETKKEPNEKTAIFGHTPSTNLAYKSLNGNICIDTACVFGYQLCAFVEEGGICKFVYENKSEDD